MGASQSSHSTPAATVSEEPSTSSSSHPKRTHIHEEHLLDSKVLNTPIFGVSDDNNDESTHKQAPIPTGHEYDLMDQIASDLPSVMDDESRAQVEEYIRSCNNGKGPMVACFSTAEYLSLFLRKHGDAADLYYNTCFRPIKDKSPNGVEVDGTKAYPPSCFNLAQMRMTGKGQTTFSRKEGYELFDRACRGGHGGACYMQAKMLMSYPGSLGPGVPYDVAKAAGLLKYVCEEREDSVSCFTLATMLLRGDKVNADADNVSPMEARGEAALLKREHEANREKLSSDRRTSLARDPVFAEQLLQRGCSRGHAPSCYNLAVMYTQGDEGVEKDDSKAKDYQAKTEELVKRFGGFGMGGM
jgi:TPR repeat protein